MKAFFLSFSFLLLSLCALAQSKPGRNIDESFYFEERDSKALNMAGEHLQKYTREFYIGTALIAGGYLVVGVSALGSINNPQGGPGAGILVGGLTMAGGFVLQLISHRHIGKAGRFLKNSTVSQNLHLQGSHEGMGLGVAYRF